MILSRTFQLSILDLEYIKEADIDKYITYRSCHEMAALLRAIEGKYMFKPYLEPFTYRLDLMVIDADIWRKIKNEIRDLLSASSIDLATYEKIGQLLSTLEN